MANELALTAAQISACYPDKAEIVDMIALSTITAGQPIYMSTAGLAAPADANGGGNLTQFRGIALAGAAAGAVVPVLKRGHVYGFTVAAVDCDSAVWLSNTVGRLTVIGAEGISSAIGRVVALPDGNKTRVVYVDAPWSLTQA
jgi:hypothetical protein